MEQLLQYFSKYSDLLIEYLPKVFLAIFVLIIGFWITNKLATTVTKRLQTSNLENKELQTFVSSIINIGLKILIIISVAGILGIETTSFVGVIAAMSFAIGLALQGNLSNFAAGVMILILRPFKVGDEVKINGKWMFVREIQMFHTVFRNFDNSFTIIPNSNITSGPLQNLTAQDIRKLSIPVHIPYTEDFKRVKKLVFEAGEAIEGAKRDFLFIDGLKDHYVQASFIFAISKENYWGVEGPLKQAIIEALSEHKVQVAYPTGVTILEAGNPRS
ncbi:MAG: mechanosensitive ion channel family protein [Aureispira sp.]